MSVNWDSPLWGMAGHNTHEDSTGSWLLDRTERDNDSDN